MISALIRRCDDLPATITHVPVAAVLVLNTPDDGRLRPKHVEWPCRNKTRTVLHQAGVSFDLFSAYAPRQCARSGSAPTQTIGKSLPLIRRLSEKPTKCIPYKVWCTTRDLKLPRELYENRALLRCDKASSGKFLPMFLGTLYGSILKGRWGTDRVSRNVGKKLKLHAAQ